MNVNEKVRVRLLALYQAAQQSKAAFDLAYATALESLDLDPAVAYQVNLETGAIVEPAQEPPKDA